MSKKPLEVLRSAATKNLVLAVPALLALIMAGCSAAPKAPGEQSKAEAGETTGKEAPDVAGESVALVAASAAAGSASEEAERNGTSDSSGDDARANGAAAVQQEEGGAAAEAEPEGERASEAVEASDDPPTIAERAAEEEPAGAEAADEAEGEPESASAEAEAEREPEGAGEGAEGDGDAGARVETSDDAPSIATDALDEEESRDGSFSAWMASFKRRAAEAGVSEDTLGKLDAIQPISRVIELDRRQPERRFTLQQYLARVVPDSRVEEGRRRYAEHRDILEGIGEKYGVQPRFLVALWGIETDYGRNTGGFRVLDALATLAHDGRRAAFFETELINALKIIDGGHVTAETMLGSWAGALGQCQFMPSSFMSYAVDHTGDGRRDIWTSLPDVFASSANYLSRHGWRPGQTWGREVRLPEGFDRSLIGLGTKKPLERWQELGVRRSGGSDLPRADFEGSLVQPGGASGPTYLVYENYRTIMRWNRSHYFATAVGLLADRIAQ